MKKQILIFIQIILIIFFVTLFGVISWGQTTTIDFEVAGNGYTPSTTSGTGFEDVFNRTNPNIGGNSTYMWSVEDLPVTNPSIALDQINITGASSFTFSIDMLAHHYNDWDDTDELLITYSIDGGAYQNLMWVQNAGATYNQTASLDTDFDGDGECGAGLTLPSLTTGTSGCTVSSSTFETFTTSSIALSGNSTLDIILQFNQLTSTDEGIYLDNIVITQVSSTPIPEIQIEGNSIEIIDGDVTPSTTDDTDFGIVDVAGGTQANTFTIKNTGSADLTINSISSSNSSEFAIGGTTSGTITAGNSVTFTITFDPASTGTKTSTITVDNDDSNESTYDFAVEGEGQNACVTPTAQPTVLDLTSNTTTTSIYGSFIAASPIADSYLVVYRTSSSLSSNPVDGTTYSAGSSLGGGTVVGNFSGTTFTVSGLISGTEYYFFIFANNNASCIGGPVYNTTSPLEGSEITIPENSTWNAHGCVDNTSIVLNWSDATGGKTGYLLVVREGGLAPHSVNSLDPSTQTYNTDYSACTVAEQFGSTNPKSRVVYKGSATTITITGLNTDSIYKFKLYTYKIGSSPYVYSSGTLQTNTISLENVSSASSTCSDSQSSISWSNPNSSCFDEIMVVANETSGISFSPSGNGSAYTANSVYSATDQVVYKGTGTNVTVTSLTNGTTYYFEIFTRKGTQWSNGVEVSCTPNAVTTLYPGDLAIVAINTQFQSSGSADEVCFFAFKDITNGTAIDFTDNGYEREVTGKWGGYEGTIRLTRTGGTIDKGTVICVQGYGNAIPSSQSGSIGSFSMYLCGSNDDANWDISCLNTVGSTHYSYDLNSSDQIWIMQGGNWTNPGGEGAATYDGNILYGWTATDWKTSPGYSDSKGSTLYDGADCFNTNVTGTLNEYKVKFYSDTSQILSQSNWIGEINSSGNWTGYSSNANYDIGGLDYSGSCVKFHIDNSLGNGAGRWQGGEDNNWFNCANWLNMKVPDQTIDVTILSNALNEANIDNTQPDANIYGPIAKCKNLTIEDGGDSIYVQIDDATSDELQIKENLTLESNAKLYNDNGGILTVDGNIIINDGALIDMHANPTTGSIINLKGNWTDYNTVDDNTHGLYEADGQIIFTGTTAQTISDATGNETFYDLKMNNSAGLNLNGNDATISGTLDLTTGDITTGSNNVVITNSATGSIINHSTSSYINGNLTRAVTTGSYDLPVGTSANYEDANINLTNNTGISTLSAKFTNPVGTTDITSLGLTVDGTPLTTLLDYGYWTITPDAGTGDYNVTVISRGHTNGGSQATQHTIVKRPNNSNPWVSFSAPNHSNATQSGTGTSPITAKLSTLTGFSDFAIARSQNNPLPIELLSFNGQIIDSYSYLNWITSSEINNDYFSVERSIDGRFFNEIGIVAGAGNSSSRNSYGFVDESPKNINYYRLKQYDYDGKFSYSNTISLVNNSTKNDIEFYENNNSIYLKLPELKLAKLSIYNSIGEIVYSKRINELENKIDLNSLNKGIYIAKIEFDNYTKNKKIIIK